MAGGEDWRKLERFHEALIRAAVRLKAAFSRLLRPGSLVAIVVVTIAAVGALLKEADLPSESAWEGREPLAIGLVLIAAFA